MQSDILLPSHYLFESWAHRRVMDLQMRGALMQSIPVRSVYLDGSADWEPFGANFVSQDARHKATAVRIAKPRDENHHD